MFPRRNAPLVAALPRRLRSRGSRDQADDQTFEIPFPRPEQSFIEIANVEDNVAFGVANAPKFAQCALPLSCTMIPLTGFAARSRAMRFAVPR